MLKFGLGIALDMIQKNDAAIFEIFRYFGRYKSKIDKFEPNFGLPEKSGKIKIPKIAADSKNNSIFCQN